MTATAEAAAGQARQFMSLADKLRDGKMTLATATTLLDESIAYLSDLLGEVEFLLEAQAAHDAAEASQDETDAIAAADDGGVVEASIVEIEPVGDCGCCDGTVTGGAEFCADCLGHGCDKIRAHPDSTPDPETGRIPQSAGTGPELLRNPIGGADADLDTFSELSRTELDVLAYSLTSGWKKQNVVWPTLCEAWWDTQALIHDCHMTMQAASHAALVPPPDPDLPAGLPGPALDGNLCGLANPDELDRVCSAPDGHPEPNHALHGARGRVVMYWPVTEAEAASDIIRCRQGHPDCPDYSHFEAAAGLVAGSDGFVRPLALVSDGSV